MKIIPFNADSFNGLNEFEHSKQLLTKNEEAIEYLGELIREYDLEDKIGICLLHKHFNLQPAEVLVEKILKDEITIGPRLLHHDEETIPYMWRFSGIADGDFNWTPLEFVEKTSVSDAVLSFSKLLPKLSEFFDVFSVRLLSLGLSDVFGLALHHRSGLSFNRRELILLETEDPITRELSIKPVNRRLSMQSDFTQTLWRFPKNGSKIVESLCDLHGCAGHCGSHSGTYTY